MDKKVGKKVYILEPDRLYSTMFMQRGWEVTPRLENADLVQFTGGEDVSPRLYGEWVHPYSRCNWERDKREISIYERVLNLGIPMAGICRGGQFLNVMQGGKMYQHVNNHGVAGTHMMVDTRTGALIPVTSTHHQMMRPGANAEVLCVASESTLYEYMDGEFITKKKPERGEDIEVLFYPQHGVLCYQPHPEYMDQNSPCQQKYFDLIEEKLCVA